jgi:hypothetical protein
MYLLNLASDGVSMPIHGTGNSPAIKYEKYNSKKVAENTERSRTFTTGGVLLHLLIFELTKSTTEHEQF